MIRTSITMISIAFAIAIYINSSIHNHFLEKKNDELYQRVNFFQESCKETIQTNSKLYKRNIKLSMDLNAIQRNRPGRLKNLATLKKAIKKRNKKYGIGGR